MTVITDDLPARLLHEEHEAWDAILDGRGGEYYQSSLTRDGLVIVPGAIITRDQIAASFEGGEPWEEYEIREPAIIRLGDHSGILAYRVILRRGGDLVRLAMSTTYLFEDGGWCVALHQQTPVD